MSILSDHELWISFKNGDLNSFSVIYKRYYAPLYAYGLGMNMKDESIKDAIQEVFLKLYFNTNFEVKGDNLKFYLLKAIRNQLLDVIKLKKESVDISQAGHNFSIDFTIEDKLIKEEEYNQLRLIVESVLDRLTDRQKEIMYLHFIEEISYEDIAGMMNIKVQSVRNIVFKAMEKLKGLNPDEFMFLIALLCLQQK